MHLNRRLFLVVSVRTSQRALQQSVNDTNQLEPPPHSVAHALLVFCLLFIALRTHSATRTPSYLQHPRY